MDLWTFSNGFWSEGQGKTDFAGSFYACRRPENRWEGARNSVLASDFSAYPFIPELFLAAVLIGNHSEFQIVS